MILKIKDLQAWLYYESDAIGIVDCQEDQVFIDFKIKEDIKSVYKVSEDTVLFIDYSKIEFPINNKSLKMKMVSINDSDGDTFHIYTNQRGYILNNQGQTIERIN
jgi:hypothetical protein